ncbi:DUF1080 domain-containing protein [Luteolibacter sp. Populi]|uniref:3-keto-disaccharide hydrolase n=1 Tax=Luteolibacter sp. Populi TaxID=3230487 RepID=UPI003467D4AE
MTRIFPTALRTASLLVLLPLSLLAEQKPAASGRSGKPARAVTEKINVFDLIRNGEIYYHLNPKAELHDKPEDVFLLKDKELTITGRGYGCLYTADSFKDYRLVVEFKWTGRTWGDRADRARDNGILLHCHGPEGALGGTWVASIEAQIIEGGMGDMLVLNSGLPDAGIQQTKASVEVETDRDGEKRWKPGAPRQEILNGRINWEKRHEDWDDKVGIRFADDLEAPIGEWNKLEVIARGSTLVYLFNGKKVNEAFDVHPGEGPIGIQTEAAEMVVRRYELLPLDQTKP